MDRLRYSIEPLDVHEAPLSRRQLGVGRFSLGRGADCDLQLDVRGVSRAHVELTVLPSGGMVVRDLGSTNGTRVDGRPVQEAAFSGDFDLDLGVVRLRFREHASGLDLLAFSTGDAPAAIAAVADPEAAGTRMLTLRGQLREAAIAALQACAGEDWRNQATAIAAAWLKLMGGGLRLLSPEGLVLAQAVATDSPDWHLLAEGDGFRVEAEAKLIDALAPLGPGLSQLLAWLPRAESLIETASSGNVDPGPGEASANPEFRRLLEGLARAARSRIGVLLLGETGVGKELLARWLHDRSPRAGKAFVAVNCAALPRDLLEAELFGIEKGAATGVEARPGLFERAHGGTLFLDELGDMPLDTQVRLLRALEDGRVHRVGGQRLIETDVRIVAATHQDLQQAIADKRFRLDLYHRVAGVVAELPPLRQRPEDIAPLAIHFFTEALAENAIRSPGIAAEALLCLQRGSWPGNVRELRQTVQGAVVMLAQGEALMRSHLPLALQGVAPDADSLRLEQVVLQAERGALITALAATGGEHRRAWALLGIGKTTFYKKLREQGLMKDRTEEAADLED